MWAMGKALMWAVERIREYAPKSERVLATEWATGKALVWALEMVRE